MATFIEASTNKAGRLFSTAEFHVPDFQRDYSWVAKDEVNEFWRDLHRGLDSPPYFLGLLIFTEEVEGKTVVDGQQRLVTLSLLANSIRKAAQEQNKALVADSMRDIFLYTIDYEKNERSPRIKFASDRDNRTFDALLDNQPFLDSDQNVNGDMVGAQRLLDQRLQADLKGVDASSRLGKWAHFLTNGLTFAVFEHPTRNAAFKVFEVINTRGKDLTPAQLIKSYVVGSSPTSRVEAAERWSDIEDPFIEAGVESQFTQFIRSVVTLHLGYVEARNLYQVITENFQGEEGCSKLLDALEQNLDTYLQMVNPPQDSTHVAAKTFAILDVLGLRTIRPVFLATSYAEGADNGFKELLRIVIPRLATGSFGTGNIERRFSEAAEAIYAAGQWTDAVSGLRDLAPSREDFREAVQTRSINKGTQTVLRASFLQQCIVPGITDYLYQVRPRRVENWPKFDDEEFKELGSTVGNFLFSTQERRPRGTNSIEEVLARLIPTAVEYEDEAVRSASSWSADDVRSMNERFSMALAEVWYD